MISTEYSTAGWWNNRDNHGKKAVHAPIPVQEGL